MPSLNQFADPDALDNAYSDKVIVYVEGTDDLGFFNDLVGPNLADRLEFKVPEDGMGYQQVKARVAQLRPDNAKIHGLLDGDAAVSFDLFADFLSSEEVFFHTNSPDLQGLLFLSEHELENLVLCHVDVATFLSQHVPFGQLGQKPAPIFRDELTILALRFYFFTLLKFTAGDLHRSGTPCKVIDAYAGLFVTKQSVARILRTMIKPKLAAAGIDWDTFFDAVRVLAKRVRDHLEAKGHDADARKQEVLRLADGKLMLRKVRTDYAGSPGWEGLLQGQLKQGAYADHFREALIAATGCNDN